MDSDSDKELFFLTSEFEVIVDSQEGTKLVQTVLHSVALNSYILYIM